MESQVLLPRRETTLRPPVIRSSSQDTSHEQTAANMQTTAMLPEQSLSLVEIFLNAAIASVLYTRELLRHDSTVFSERCVADLLSVWGPIAYDHFLNLNTQAGRVRSQVFKILLKGRSRKADQILTLLEGGIFHALQLGYLEAVQLSICTDSSRPSEVVECYTFAFTYSVSSERAGHTVSSIRVTSEHQAVFFVGDAQKSFNAAIKSLLKLLRGLPQLPRRRNLGLNLFYTDDCPADYEPQGFTGCTDDDLCFPGGRGLARKSQKTSGLVAGAHRIGVIVSHVHSAEDKDQMKIIPAEVDYSLKHSRLEEYKVAAKTPARSVLVSSKPLPGSGNMASPAAPSTQTRDDMQIKEALQRMQRSSSRAKELVPTQSLVHIDDIDAEESRPPDQSYSYATLKVSQSADSGERMIVPTKMAELIIHVRAIQRRCLLADAPFDQDALDAYKIKRKEQSNVVRCECTDRSEEGIMLFCGVCGTWQHQTCYGWDQVHETHRPIDHVCYRCLLLPEEKDLNDWTPILVACRNVLKYLYAKGFPSHNKRALIEAMRFKGNPRDLMASEVMQILVKQQLIAAEYPHRVVENNIHRGWVEYMDPLASIFHLYKIHDDEQAPLPSTTKEAVESLELAYNGFALDAIRTRDSFGEEVIRYGYYPHLAAIQSRKRSASVLHNSEDGAGAGAGADARGGESANKTLRTRKMSRSEMVRFDETSSEGRTETVLESDSDDDHDHDVDMYN